MAHLDVTIGRGVCLYRQENPNDAFSEQPAALNFKANSFRDNANPPARWEHSLAAVHIKDQTALRFILRNDPVTHGI
jgi:hypothetical protein